MISRPLPINFDIACYIASLCAVSAEGRRYQSEADHRDPPKADTDDPRQIWHTVLRYGRQYQNW